MHNISHLHSLYLNINWFTQYEKIGVVIGVLGVLLLGIIGFLFYLERRLKKIEDRYRAK